MNAQIKAKQNTEMKHIQKRPMNYLSFNLGPVHMCMFRKAPEIILLNVPIVKLRL